MSTAASLPVSPPFNASQLLEQLPDDVPVLKSMIVELATSLHLQGRELEGVRHRINLLLQRIFGPRSERYNPNQPLLFPEMAEGQDPAAAAPPASTAEGETEKKPKRRCRPHGRRRLPENLPREPRHHELTQAERLCSNCGESRIDIGVDKSEQLDYRPASLIVIEHFVHKYLCPCCSKPSRRLKPGSTPLESTTTPPLVELPRETMEPQSQPSNAEAVDAPPELPSTGTAVGEATVASAPQSAKTNADSSASPPAELPCEPAELQPLPTNAESVDAHAELPPTEPASTPRSGVVISALKPESPIAKGLPAPGLLAHLIVSKYVDHLPLYRLERIYERQGVFLPRSTTCDWLAACALLLRPLYDNLVSLLLQSRVIHTDDTPVKMLDPPPDATATGRMWGYLGDDRHPYNAFDFTPNHKRDGPQRFLKSFQGYLQADAFSGYNGLYLPSPRDGVARIFEVACNAHARRKFYEARSSDAMGAHQALGYYRALYELERQAKQLGFDEDQRRRMRQDIAVPLLDKFRAWLDVQKVQVLPKSPMAEAIGYALNQWTALVRYTEAGFLEIDNNVAEREMKKIAIGRKNWLFVGTVKGGETAAVLLSFTSTCQRLKVEPWAYLQHVLTRLPTTPVAQLADLLPDRWQAARHAAATPPTPTP